MIVPDLREDGALLDEPRESAGEVLAEAVQVIRAQLIDGQKYDGGGTLGLGRAGALLDRRR